MIPAAPRRELLHATAVAHAGRAVLILGPSGAGKSSLAIRMLALGADLVSDDLTEVEAGAEGLIARCPRPDLRGVIESRGIGLLRVPHSDRVPVALAVDLAQEETARLPPLRSITLLGMPVPLVLRPQNDHLSESILLILAGGRHDGGGCDRAGNGPVAGT